MPLREIRYLPASQAIAGLLVGLIFWADIVLPAAVAVPMLYIVPTILFVGGSRLAEPLVVAATATVLTMVGFYASPDAGEGRDLPNRAIAIAVIWIVAGLVVTYVRRVETWTAQMRDSNLALESSVQRLQDMQADIVTLPEAEHTDFQRLAVLSTQKQELERRLTSQMRLKNLLEAWLYIHLLVSIAMLVAVAIHIIVVLYY